MANQHSWLSLAAAWAAAQATLLGLGPFGGLLDCLSHKAS